MQFRIVGMRVVVILGRIFFLVSFGLEYIGRDGPPRAALRAARGGPSIFFTCF